jgi:hypothetical protein
MSRGWREVTSGDTCGRGRPDISSLTLYLVIRIEIEMDLSMILSTLNKIKESEQMLCEELRVMKQQMYDELSGIRPVCTVLDICYTLKFCVRKLSVD